MEKPPGLSVPERIPCEYTQEDLEKDIAAWMDSFALGFREGYRKEMKASPLLTQFTTYQNNFHMMVRCANKWILDDGSLNEEAILKENKGSSNPLTRENPKWPQYIEYYEKLVELNHSREVYEVIKSLGYDPVEMENLPAKLSEEHLEKIKNIWIEMRKLGFNRMELIG